MVGALAVPSCAASDATPKGAPVDAGTLEAALAIGEAAIGDDAGNRTIEPEIDATDLTTNEASSDAKRTVLTDGAKSPLDGRFIDPGTAGDGDFVENGPYAAGPEAMKQPGVPAGQMMGGFSVQSAVYGLTYGYSVYVPAQYDAKKPAALMVFTDGGLYTEADFGVDHILDNLIAKKDIPVMVGVFIGPGADHRREEYDAITDAFARFMADELLPDVKKHLNLLDDPRAHGIAGHSSGGVAAFVTAWHRPDAFGKAMTHDASIHNYLGADMLPDIVSNSPVKPIRVSLMSGPNDRADFGIGNRRLADALKAKGYHYRLIWGDMEHGSPAVAQTMPDTLRWLWRDLPAE